ncbi:MAG: UPF0280 family protein [Desulfobacterales bacterium]|nr:UPF0280 family protein [Desulfobacterales bacterium]
MPGFCYITKTMVAASAKRKKKKSPLAFRERTYRALVETNGLVSSRVMVAETDLHILAPGEVTGPAREGVYRYRAQLENYIVRNPGFLKSLRPLPADPLAPPIVKQMLAAGLTAGVGPMAAVAGAMAQFVGQDLLAAGSSEIMVENGGDIFVLRNKDCTAAIFAGDSPLNQRVGVKIPAGRMPLGICTSSASVGHSLSLGRADSVTVLSRSTPLADAAATRLGNEVIDKDSINRALEVARTIPGILGVVIIMGSQLGAWGGMDLVRLD